jgi:filamentous hemagglutinin
MGEHIGRAADGSQKAGAPGTPVPNNGKVSANAPIALLASGDASSVTQSGISGATVKINDDAKQQALTGQTAAETVAAINTDVSSDRDGSNKLKPIFNPQEIQAGFDITAKFVQNVGVYLESRASEADAKLKQADKEHADAKDETLSYEDRDAHLKKAQLLEQQAKDISNDWGAGGTYRQIATALVAGASGNVTGGSSQFAQNMFVNYVQQQGSDYIGKLVINGLKEGSPEHAGLHAILGCAGAAASQQSCSAGALGGSASSVLAGLFNETDPNETKEEREAKRNIIASVVTGIAAMSNPNGAATATNAAIANVDNNWLATQQIVQMTKELAEAKSTPEVVAVFGKWLAISGNQDLITGTALFNSFKDSMAGSGVDVLNSAVGVLRDPVATVDAMREFAESADGKKLLGAAADTFKSQINQIREALVVGGDENAENLGKQLGEAVALYAQLIATGGAGGAAKESWLLSKAGVEVTSSGIKEIAAGVKATGGIEAKLAKLEKIGPDPDVPSVAPVESPNHVSVDTQAALTQQVADLRATLTGSAKTSGNVGVAQIDIPGIQPTMAASSRIGVATADQQALGFVGEVPETFPSTVVPTGSNPPQMLNRAVDSEAKILNNIAAQLGDNTSVMGNINLLTERPPCASCSNVIDLFKAKYPNITVNVFDNGGVIRPTKKGL